MASTKNMAEWIRKKLDADPGLAADIAESILETVSINCDPQALADVARGIAELRAGKGIPWDEALRQLGQLEVLFESSEGKAASKGKGKQ